MYNQNQNTIQNSTSNSIRPRHPSTTAVPPPSTPFDSQIDHMSSSGKRWTRFKNILKPNGGWGCGPKTTDVVEVRHASNSSSDQFHRRGPSSSVSSWERHGGRRSIIGGGDEEDHTSTTFSLNIDTSSPETHNDHPKCAKLTVISCRKIHDSFAVVKDSEDPLSDFRKSMLQMIFEREIYSRSDLQQLLDCFLRLNSPQHRDIIIQAFMEIWNNGGGGGGGAGWTPP